MKIKVVILSTLVLISTLVQASNDNLKKAWGYFKENNNKEAMAAFQEAKADATCKSEALLGIAMLHRSMGQADDAFNAFKEFYNSNDDSYAYAYALWTSGIIFSDYSKKHGALYAGQALRGS